MGLCVVALVATCASVAVGSGPGTPFERAWGKNVGGPGIAVCTVATSCQAGAQGGLGGDFDSPGSVATDAAGNVYVADTFNERVQKFDASGVFVLAWGKNVGGAGVGICTAAATCQAGSIGVQGGEFAANGPDGVATDGDGNVYVAEYYGNRIQKFTSSGAFVRAWGKNVGGAGIGVCTVAADCQAAVGGGLGGELTGPQSVATDANGDVYVAESGNSRIQKFDSSGAFLRAWGKNVGGAGVGTCTVAVSCHQGNLGGLGAEFSSPYGVATDGAGAVYVTDALYRVQKFDSSGAFLRAWGKNVGGAGVGTCTVAANCQPGTSGAQGGEFNANGAAGVATDTAGHVYVANAAAGGRVSEFDSSGAFLQAFGKDVGGIGVGVCTLAAGCQVGSAGVFGGEFDGPVSVATGPAGALYVADYFNRRIQRFAAAAAPAPPTPPVVVPPVVTPAPAPAAPKPISATSAFALPSAKACISRRAFTIRIRKLPGVTFASAVVKVNGKRVKTLARSRITAPVNLKGLPAGKVKVSITATATDGRSVTGTRTYRTCTAKRRSQGPRL